MTDWNFASCMAAFGAGAILSVAYLGVLWLSARQTVHWRTLLPWGAGMALRLGLLAGGFAVLVASKSEPSITLSAMAGFIVACWALMAIMTYGVDQRQKEQK